MEVFTKVCLSLLSLFERVLKYVEKKSIEKQRDSISSDASRMLVDKFRGENSESPPTVANSKIKQGSDT